MKHRLFTLGLATALAAVPAPGEAIAPALLFMVKQIAQQAATSMIKDALLSSLSGMGCKGIALSNALRAFDLRGGGGAGALMGGMPKMPAGHRHAGMLHGQAAIGLLQVRLGCPARNAKYFVVVPFVGHDPVFRFSQTQESGGRDSRPLPSVYCRTPFHIQ